MDIALAWQQLFENWPDSVPKQGIVVTSFQETIPFTNFSAAPGIIAFERDRPDSSGARKVLLSFAAIAAVKMTDTNDLSHLSAMGFG